MNAGTDSNRESDTLFISVNLRCLYHCVCKYLYHCLQCRLTGRLRTTPSQLRGTPAFAPPRLTSLPSPTDMSGLSGYGGVPTSSTGAFLPSTGGWPVPGQPAAGWGAPANPFMVRRWY